METVTGVKQERKALVIVSIVPIQVFPNLRNFFLSVVNRARHTVVRPDSLQPANLVQLVDSGHVLCQDSVVRVAEREGHDHSIVVLRTIEVSLVLNRITLLAAQLNQRVFSCNPNAAIHEPSVCRMDARCHTWKQGQSATRLDRSQLDGCVEAMHGGVTHVQITKIDIHFIQPAVLFLGSLQDAGHTNAHAHVLANNRLSFRMVARQHQGVFVDPVEQFTDIRELFNALDVRQEDFCQTASFKVIQRLLSTRVVALDIRIRVVNFTEPPNLARET